MGVKGINHCLFLLIFFISISYKSEGKDLIDSLKQEYNSVVETGNLEEQILLLNKIADQLYQVGELREAHSTYSKVVDLSMESNLLKQHARALSGLAHIDWRWGENITAIEYALESLDIFYSIGDTVNICYTSDILAGIYVSLGKLSEAEKLYVEVLEIAKKTGNRLNEAISFEHLGVVKFFEQDYKSSIEYYTKAGVIFEQLGDNLRLAISKANTGEAYLYLGEFESAIDLLCDAKEIMEMESFLSGLIFSYYSIGNCFTQLGQFDKGIKYYDMALELVKQTGEDREKPQIFKLISENYSAQGKYQESLDYFQKSVTLGDSIDNIQKTRLIEEIRTKYDFEKKEKENNALLEQNKLKEASILVQNRKIYIQYIIGILLISFLCVSYFSYKKVNKQKDELNAVNRIKDQILRVIGHDLRGPVGNLKVITDIITSDHVISDPEEQNKILKQLKEEINDTYFLLTDLLAWSQLQRDNPKLIFSEFNILEQIDKAVRILEPGAIRKNITIEFTKKDLTEMVCFSDPNMIQSVIRNIVGNAVKFTPENGSIRIFVDRDDKNNCALIRVSDSGLGIHQPNIKRIFEYKGINNSKGTMNESGTGIGLSLCKDIIEMCNGDIGLEENHTSGTTFYFTVPLSTT
ncbi:tetratricopeptide repeat-containing sensor histidine kinase [Marinigracilibium pacificum]|uniref:histidine kinase n=1 Tax=Marinigracilibium pacificum TaxID=2729599 RepID=A0A848IZ72_9BACT|nr:tetratricopeptide repeat-containing sensor histidine kinase [Marinigracilibium pacificum]NMM48585.1 sensor histidine kinase [Marinigracilibium pacificum]